MKGGTSRKAVRFFYLFMIGVLPWARLYFQLQKLRQDRSVCPSPLIETCSRLVSDLLFVKYIGDFFRNSKFLSHAPSSSVLLDFRLAVPIL